MAKVVDRARCSPIPILAALPLHCDAGGIAHLDPARARTGSIGAIHSLRDDALGTKLASVLEHGRTVLGDVLVEQNASLDTAQQPRQRGLAVEERKIAKIAAIVLDRIEGIQHRAMRSLSAAQLVEA